MTTDLEGTTELDYAHQEGLALVAQAQQIQVKDQASYEEAGAFARVLKGHERRVLDLFKPMKQRAKEAHQEIVDAEKRMLEGPQAGYRVLERQMGDYEAEQRAKKAAAEAEAAKEQARLMEAAFKSGEKAMPVVVAPKAVAIPEADGIGFRTTWEAVVVDPLELVKAVAAGKITLEVVQWNMPLLNDWARQLKGAMSVPGVKAQEKRSMRARPA